MEQNVCAVCLKPKAPKLCELCGAHICKSCQETLPADAFLLMSKRPKDMSHASYCVRCYDAKVVPQLEAYEVMAQRAKDIYYISKAYPGYVRVLAKHTKKVSVENSPDRREAILKMAYQAAELNFNAIIDAEVESSKVRNHGYQSSLWRGSCMPAQIDGERLEITSLRRI